MNCLKCDSVLIGKQRKYCSEKCRQNYLNTKKHERSKECGLTKKCIVCDEDLDGIKQKFCSPKCKQKHHYYNKTRNSYYNQTIRGWRRKIYFIDKLGGKCSKCGYSKNLSALNFHHIKPEEKKFRLDSRAMANKKKETLEIEISKCEILCSNCHSEEHHPDLDIKNIMSILEEYKNITQ